MMMVHRITHAVHVATSIIPPVTTGTLIDFACVSLAVFCCAVRAATQLYFPFFVVFVAFTVHFATKHRAPAGQGHCTRTEGGCPVLELKNLLPQLVAGILAVASLLRIIWCFIEADEYGTDPYVLQ